MPAQLALFAEESRPAALQYEPNFISEDEERGLIARFAEVPFAPFQFGAFEGKRRVAYYGFRYDFSQQRLHEAEPTPNWITPLARRVERFASLPEGEIQHVLFTEYEEGVGIGWHRDKKQFDEVF